MSPKSKKVEELKTLPKERNRVCLSLCLNLKKECDLVLYEHLKQSIYGVTSKQIRFIVDAWVTANHEKKIDGSNVFMGFESSELSTKKKTTSHSVAAPTSTPEAAQKQAVDPVQSDVAGSRPPIKVGHNFSGFDQPQ